MIGGPRGSNVVPDDFDWYIFIGDETALPAIGRWVEQLRMGVPVATYIMTEGADDRQMFKTASSYRSTWLVRSNASDEATAIKSELAGFVAPPGDGFVWIGAEAAVARGFARLLPQRPSASQGVGQGLGLLAARRR